jgi:hypothetical protein
MQGVASESGCGKVHQRQKWRKPSLGLTEDVGQREVIVEHVDPVHPLECSEELQARLRQGLEFQNEKSIIRCLT